MKRNPSHYRLEGQAVVMDIDQKLDEICEKDIKLLEELSLISDIEGKLKSTPFGVAMATYYVKLETIRGLLALPEKSKLSDIVSYENKCLVFLD